MSGPATDPAVSGPVPAGAERRRPPVVSPRVRAAVVGVLSLVLACGVLWGGYVAVNALRPRPDQRGAESAAALPEQRQLDDIAFTDVRQFIIRNETMGNIVVIQGNAVNNYAVPKEKIVVEARLFDKENKVLAVQRQMCGTSLTDFQLQVLGERELAQALNNPIDILTTNSNVAPGTSVPFVIAFTTVPEDLWEFEVYAVDARDVPEQPE